MDGGFAPFQKLSHSPDMTIEGSEMEGRSNPPVLSIDFHIMGEDYLQNMSVTVPRG